MSQRLQLFQNLVLDSLSSCRKHIRPTSNLFEVLYTGNIKGGREGGREGDLQRLCQKVTRAA